MLLEAETTSARSHTGQFMRKIYKMAFLWTAIITSVGLLFGCLILQSGLYAVPVNCISDCNMNMSTALTVRFMRISLAIAGFSLGGVGSCNLAWAKMVSVFTMILGLTLMVVGILLHLQPLPVNGNAVISEQYTMGILAMLTLAILWVLHRAEWQEYRPIRAST